jgi:hydrogenase maturation factor
VTEAAAKAAASAVDVNATAAPAAPAAENPPPSSSCAHGTCVTCSDTAVAVTILELLDDALALVDAGGGVRETVSVALVPGARVGETILVHAGEAIGRIPDAGGPQA